ncbi:sugar phosphate isomerase/epimerase [Dyadobacter sp. LJ53]|uniref:sugar phosphate isomerase/epimerase family protein n=1 Tax=Dyadobacter chenwenxiniae TaxID=2906456 RepID=UPI001F26BAD4|nr:sugar phosphate isomerase/epimerase [Dyadobacter chenwenxiniae]MCF0049805.1 sugar phosphate isomerase/epimerase [Dyadobacter chenwenxiniae]MCF0049883.1 sugar phosphate isomerase/epimerase [Dyadobacter chenwenxiniae]
MTMDRRTFMNSLAVSAGAAFLPEKEGIAPAFPISCNQYSWITFYAREGKDWGANLDQSLKEFASTGLKAYEPAFTQADEVAKLLPVLKKYQLAMPSVYVNSSLHKADEAAKSIESVLAIADALKPADTKIIVTNPNPLQWGGSENKNDSELAEQAKNLNKLGAELQKRGMTLAYHTHDVELRAAAREFHHMLLATDPKNVSLCLDVHWVYRGSGNSQVALFDIVKLYGKRIVELHLRQSKDGIWQEAFSDGDIDYRRLLTTLNSMNVKPHLVLEQCLEKTSPKTMDAVEAHKKDLLYSAEIFKDWLK